MTRTKLRPIALAGMIALALITMAVAPAAATHDGDESDTIAEVLTADDDGMLAAMQEVAVGLSTRGSTFVSSINPFADVESAETLANDTESTFNANSAALVDYANQRNVPDWMAHHSDRSNDVDVVAVTFSDPDGGEETRYVVAQYNSTSGEYDNAEMIASTSNTVDASVELSDTASMNAPSDFEAFVDDYVQQDENPPRSYRRGLAAQYAGNVDSALIPDVGLTGLTEGI